MEKEMATHSGTLAWKIPRMEKASVHVVAKSQIRLHFSLSDMQMTPPLWQKPKKN